MSRPQRNPFWDRDVDREGRLIRPDVRSAAQEIWADARRMTESILGDSAEAGEILEVCVARVSRYLDDRNHKLFTQRTSALLRVAMRNTLRSYAQKRRRMEFVGSSAVLDGFPADLTWQRDVERRLDFARLVRQLSTSSRIVLTLLHAGYEWGEVAALLGVTVSKIKSSFWREIGRLRTKLAPSRPKRTLGFMDLALAATVAPAIFFVVTGNTFSGQLSSASIARLPALQSELAAVETFPEGFFRLYRTSRSEHSQGYLPALTAIAGAGFSRLHFGK